MINEVVLNTLKDKSNNVFYHMLYTISHIITKKCLIPYMNFTLVYYSSISFIQKLVNNGLLI